MRTPGYEKHTETEDLEERAFEFAAATIRFVREHDSAIPGPVTDSLVHAGTAIGLHVVQAHAGNSRRNFLAQMNSARKLSTEVSYWFKLLAACEIASKSTLRPFLEVARSLHADLTVICTKAKTQLESEKE